MGRRDAAPGTRNPDEGNEAGIQNSEVAARRIGQVVLATGSCHEIRICFPLTIYYDAACPLCADEMHALKTADTDDKLILVDCSSPEFDDRPYACHEITRESMMRLIHARDAEGRWLRGVDVFEAAYDAAGFAALAQLWGHRRLRPWWDKLYPWIARHRYALSRLGLPQLFRLLTKNAKRRSASAATRSCSTGACSPGKK